MNDVIFLAIAGGVGLMVGYACGRWPYNAAQKRGQDTLGLVALITCTALGLVGGCLLSLPVAWVFYLAVVGSGTAPARDRRGYTGLSDEDYRRAMKRQQELEGDEPPPGRYTLIGPMVVCSDCQHASSKDAAGQVPLECPECGLRFRKATVKKARPVAEAIEVVDLSAAPPR
jgi:hypothetical protein